MVTTHNVDKVLSSCYRILVIASSSYVVSTKLYSNSHLFYLLIGVAHTLLSCHNLKYSSFSLFFFSLLLLASLKVET